MSGLSMAIVIGATIVGGGIAYAGHLQRFEIQRADAGSVWVLDKATGKVRVCVAGQSSACFALTQEMER